MLYVGVGSCSGTWLSHRGGRAVLSPSTDRKSPAHADPQSPLLAVREAGLLAHAPTSAFRLSRAEHWAGVRDRPFHEAPITPAGVGQYRAGHLRDPLARAPRDGNGHPPGSPVDRGVSR